MYKYNHLNNHFHHSIAYWEEREKITDIVLESPIMKINNNETEIKNTDFTLTLIKEARIKIRCYT